MQKKIIISLISIIILTIPLFILVQNNLENSDEIIAKESLITYQSNLEEKFKIDGYTIDNPNIILDPYDASPLTALVLFETNDEVEPTITIVGKDELTTYTYKSKKSNKHYLPIYGLYADYENTIIIDNNNNDDNNDTENNNPEETNDYYRFIKMPLINVDLTNLQSQNSDTIGWLQVNGTNINYPVVKTDNNDYYLNHDFNKRYNDGGWIFADYRNNLIDDKNLIIYGHARLNLTMFGTLKNVIKANWYQNSDNYLVRLSTINSNMSFQVFSTYVTEAEDYYIKTDFNNNEDYLSFLNTLKSRSVYNYGVSLSENDRILTLSTCYTDNRRVVLHAKLIKYENR